MWHASRELLISENFIVKLSHFNKTYQINWFAPGFSIRAKLVVNELKMTWSLNLMKVRISQILKSREEKASSKTRTWTMDLSKNVSVRKTWSQGLKTLLFVQCYRKDNVKMIHFHIKSRIVQGLVFVQIKFENIYILKTVQKQIYVLKTV